MAFVDMFEFYGADAYVHFEAEAMLRMRRTARWFMLGAVLPIFLYVFVVLTFSTSADQLLARFRYGYREQIAYFEMATRSGCESTDDFDTCVAKFQACTEATSPSTGCAQRIANAATIRDAPVTFVAVSGEVTVTGGDLNDLFTTNTGAGPFDCCPPEPSYVLNILLPTTALTVGICQLFTPVLASIMVMMCVLHTHTVHLEKVMHDDIGVAPAAAASHTAGGAEALERYIYRSAVARIAMSESSTGEERTVLAAIKASTQVREVLEKTSRRWSAGTYVARMLSAMCHSLLLVVRTS
jgi:hypothetical protein